MQIWNPLLLFVASAIVTGANVTDSNSIVPVAGVVAMRTSVFTTYFPDLRAHSRFVLEGEQRQLGRASLERAGE